MTEGPIPRLTPHQVIQVIDQIRLEAEQVHELVVWKHWAVCDGFTQGIWEPNATCRDCHFEVKYAEHVKQYLLVPVPPPPAG